MDIEYSADEKAFREAVATFVRAELPSDIAGRVLDHRRLSRDDHVRWQDILARKGWLAGHWPRRFGGLDWTPVQCHIFDEETAAAGAPRLIPFGLNMVAPVIMAFGSPWQQAHYLERIRQNLDWWCQGYSEPGSGSDLASLRMSAVRDGDHYVVSGQKTWTSYAQHADMIFCLVRTAQGARRQEGISFLLIDMHSPGITVRPIILLDGEHEVNEVFFDAVRVPVENLVGEEGRGWTYAKYLLGHERTNIAGVGASKREVRSLRELAEQLRRDGRPLAEVESIARRIAEIEIDLTALEMTVLRVLSAQTEAPGPEASILKLRGTEIQQAITELAMDMAGQFALPFVPQAFESSGVSQGVGPSPLAPLAARYLNMRKVSIYGGSNEIQKNIIAQTILGL